jgi:hypothetical protein
VIRATNVARRHLAEELAWLCDERFDLNLVGLDASELERLLALADREPVSDSADD